MNLFKLAQREQDGEEKDTRSETREVIPTSCIKKLMEAQNSIRMHHWLTSSYAKHKALGKAYKDLDELIDTFVEAFIGVKGKKVLSGISGLSLTSGGDCIEVVERLETVLRTEVSKEVGSTETALLNIRDEMLATVSRTKYLLAQGG